MNDDRRFILWDRKDGPQPPRDQDTGEYLTQGCLGWLEASNCYLRSYAEYPDGSVKLDDLEIGQVIRGVVFRLSGERGEYDLYRVC